VLTPVAVAVGVACLLGWAATVLVAVYCLACVCAGAGLAADAGKRDGVVDRRA